MIEKRVINGKTYWVDVIINSDGSRVETIFGNPMQDLADTQAHAMEKVLEEQRKKNQEEFDRQQSAMVNAQLEEEYRLRKQKEDLEREVAQLEHKKRKLQPDYNPDEYDVISDNPNFALYASDEEFDCYCYIRENRGFCSRKDLDEFIKTNEWKNIIYPQILKEKEVEAQKKKEVEIKKEKESLRLNKKIEREEKLQRLILTLVILIAATLAIISVVCFNNWLIAIIPIVVGTIIGGIMYKEWF